MSFLNVKKLFSLSVYRYDIYMYTCVCLHTYIYTYISQNFSNRCTRIIFSDALRIHLCYISRIHTVTSGDIFGALTSIYIYGSINPFYYRERGRRPWNSRIAAANLNKKNVYVILFLSRANPFARNCEKSRLGRVRVPTMRTARKIAGAIKMQIIPFPAARPLDHLSRRSLVLSRRRNPTP